MKKLILIFILLAGGVNGFSQSSLFSNNNIKSYANWGIADQEAVWQYVFTSKTKDKAALKGLLVAFLKQDPFIQNVEVVNNEITADIVKLKIDIKKYGGSTRYTSQAFINGLWNGKLKIEIVEGSYEAIVDRLSFDVDRKGLGGPALNEPKEKGSWTHTVLNRDYQSFKQAKKIDLDYFNKVLIDIFDLRK